MSCATGPTHGTEVFKTLDDIGATIRVRFLNDAIPQDDMNTALEIKFAQEADRQFF